MTGHNVAHWGLNIGSMRASRDVLSTSIDAGSSIRKRILGLVYRIFLADCTVHRRALESMKIPAQSQCGLCPDDLHNDKLLTKWCAFRYHFQGGSKRIGVVEYWVPRKRLSASVDKTGSDGVENFVRKK